MPYEGDVAPGFERVRDAFTGNIRQDLNDTRAAVLVDAVQACLRS
jgi:hypothetical protein